MMRNDSILIEKGAWSSKRNSLFQDLLFLLIAAFLFLWGYGIYDYWTLKRNLAEKHDIERIMALQQEKIQLQKEKIHTQNQHLQQFARDISSLKSELLVLNHFEKQIRTVSKIVNEEGEEDLYGVGGSLPEDLDPHADLVRKQQSVVDDMHRQIERLEALLNDRKTGMEALLQDLNDKRARIDATPSIYPIRGRLTSSFGRRISPFTGRSEFHEGIDLAAPHGSPVRAAANGKVTFIGYKGSFGKTLVIDHGYGVKTRYAHLSAYLKKVGQKVKKGEPVARVGNSGRSTGPHLHYEVCLHGKPVNPRDYMVR